MRILFFSTQAYDSESFQASNHRHGFELHFQQAHLQADTAVLAQGFEVVCAFVNDDLSRPVLERLAAGGTRLVALRSAGYNHVDLAAAEALGLPVVHVPAYSPHAVAEHAVGLILTLNRRLHRAYNRTREGDFSLHGLTGFDLHGKRVGVIGTGQIGETFARIMAGFGCELLAYDPYPNPRIQALGGRYLALDALLAESDIVSLHCPLTADTRHLIDAQRLATMKPGAMLINTGRGGLVDAQALAQVGHADMARGCPESMGVEAGTGGGGVGEMAAHGLDLAEADLGQRRELPVEVAELAQGVELDREIPGNVHAGHPIG